MKKKLLSVVLAVTMAATVFVGCGSSDNSGDNAQAPATTDDGAAAPAAANDGAQEETAQESASGAYRIAMVTDSGDITDQSFNQTTYEACRDFAAAHGLAEDDFKYYKPADDSDEARVASFEQAAADGYNVVVVPGYLFSSMIEAVAEDYSDVTIIALDVSAGDFSEGYEIPSNVACFTYQEELAGYMAGYAAVKDGYTKLGFLGGMAVPAVIRYGYGFVQGCDAAAVELGNASDVEVNFVYGGKFSGDDAITAQMDTWYSNGTEVVFACGGGIYSSACEAAVKVGGKVIGVDSDQSPVLNEQYNQDGLCITSAMKGLAPTVESTLTDLFEGNWDTHAGQVQNLGLVSGTDVSLNYVQLPTDTWTFENFTVDEYKQLVADMYDGKITVDPQIDSMPATKIKVNQFDNIH